MSKYYIHDICCIYRLTLSDPVEFSISFDSIRLTPFRLLQFQSLCRSSLDLAFLGKHGRKAET